MSEIWVVFTGKADMRFLKILRPGFRHCFAIMKEGDRWLVLDPMLHKMDVSVAQIDTWFDLPSWLRAQGYRVVRAPRLAPPRRMAGIALFTCVETMKRLIGLHDWRVVTPWQLYRRLLSFTPYQGESHGKPVFQTKNA